jgi:hypothetical protein
MESRRKTRKDMKVKGGLPARDVEREGEKEREDKKE